MKCPLVKDYNLTDNKSLGNYIQAWRDNFIEDLINLSEVGQDNTGEPTYTLSQEDLDKLLNN